MADFEEFQRRHRIQKAFDEKRCVAFYQWCLRQAEGDVKNDGSLLWRIPSLGAYTFRKIAQPLTQAERLQLLHALIRNAHPGALALLDEALAPEELSVRQEFNRQCALRQPEYDAETGRWAESGVVFTDGKALGRLLVRTLTPILGQPERDKSGFRWIFENPVGPIPGAIAGASVRTTIEVVIRVPQDVHLRYGHSLLLESPTFTSGVSDSYHRLTNYLFWNGLGESEWNVAEERSAQNAVPCVEEACSRFISFAARFIASLNTSLD